MLGVPRVDTPPQATGGTQQSPRVDDSNKAKKAKSKPGSSAKTPKPKTSISTKKTKSAKSKASQIKSESSPAASKAAKSKAGRAPRALKFTPRKVNSPATNTRSKSGSPLAKTRSQHKLKRLPDRVAMVVEELQGPCRKRRSKQACRLAKRIAKIEDKIHEAMAVLNRDTGKLLKYRQLMQDLRYKKELSRLVANAFGCLAQGVGDQIKKTNTMKFIRKKDVPRNRTRDVTYPSFLCKVRNEKTKQNRT